jgi:acetyl esterase/lipase
MRRISLVVDRTLRSSSIRATFALTEQNFAPNPEINPTEKTPPTFIVQAEDDGVHVKENATVYFMALKNAKVPAELYLCGGSHGYGCAVPVPVTAWPQLVETWLRTIQILPPSAP